MESSQFVKTHPRHLAARPIIYCADCNANYGLAQDNFLGQLVECPQDPLHLCQVVKPPAGMVWLRLERWLLAYETRWTARFWFRCWGGLLSRGAGLYHLTIFVILLSISVFLYFYSDQRYEIYIAIVFGAISVYFVVDFVLDFTSVAFVSRYPAAALRSVVMVVSGFARYCIAWGIIYYCVELISGPEFNNELRIVDALYFSFIAVTTTGFGDISPVGDLAKLLVVVQVTLGIYILAAVLTVMASWANQSPNVKSVISIKDAKAEESYDSSGSIETSL